MTDNSSLLSIGELSKPASDLIEKVSDAIGGIFKPWQIRRVAQAEAEAEKIKAIAQIEIDELQRRALQRFVNEEARKQNNIENIVAKALPQVTDGAEPRKMENDWVTNFFDKCRLISDEDMQVLWSKVLAGEANAPGTYSRRTVNLLGSLDKADALLFQTLCSFGWFFGEVTPIIYDPQNEMYQKHGINFKVLLHLDEIGLVNFGNITDFQRIGLAKQIRVFYYGRPVKIEFANEKDNRFQIGRVLLSKTGQELSRICDSKPIPGYFDFIIEKWKTIGDVTIEV